jgi:hypothetical protein
VRRGVFWLGTVLVLALIQAVVSASSVPLVPRGAQPPLSYELHRVDDQHAVLTLHGSGDRRAVRLFRLPPEPLAAEPIRRPRQPAPGRREVELTLSGAPHTYKLEVNGYRPFGLLNVGR